MNTLGYFTPPFRGSATLQLVAYDDDLAFYADPTDCASITTVRRDRKKMTRRDKREADRQIEFLLNDNNASGNC